MAAAETIIDGANLQGTRSSKGKGNGSLGSDTDLDAEEDAVFGVVSVLYHALQGASAARKYIRDAESADQEELADFFQRVREDDISRAKEAKQLLLSFADEAEDTSTSNSNESDDDESDDDESDDDESDDDESTDVTDT